MGVVTIYRKRRLEEEEEEGDDRISRLPDGVLGDIVSLLPTKDGARTQALSSRWRHIWRSAPLNFALDALRFNVGGRVAIAAGEISRILAAHRGPCRRFRTRFRYLCPDDDCAAATLLDAWLRSPALDGLQELEFHCGSWYPRGRSPPPPPLAPVRRFSSTLRAASFGGCAFPAAGDLHLPVLRQLSLLHSTMSETTLQALLAGCPALESLLLAHIIGFSRLRIVSSSLRSIAVHPGTGDEKIQWLIVSGGNRILQHLVLEDAPCLERLLLFSYGHGTAVDVSVISAPKLGILGPLSDDLSRVFQGPRLTVVPRIKILALDNWHLRLDVVINFLKCFPCLEKLCIKTTTTFAGHKNEWGDEYWNLVSTFDIRVKKVVLLNYQGDTSHVNFAKFFVLNARVLESMVLELENGMMPTTEWVEKQHERLHTKNRASSGARFHFVPHDSRSWMHGNVIEEQAHDMSTVDPFVRFREWSS